MKTRYRLIRRGNRRGKFYCVDSATGQRASLQTVDEDTARQIVQAKNQALRQPALNLQIAKAYLAGSDSGVAERTWQHALDALTETKHGSNRDRWGVAGRDKSFDPLRRRIIIETQAETFLAVLKQGTVSTNIYLRRLHNFCLDMNWLPWPIIPKRQWPKLEFKEKCGITREEHSKIVEGESNAELRDYYELLWHLGGSQTDMASLCAEDVDWTDQTISYARMKTNSQAIICFGKAVAEIIRRRPATGHLFPQVVRWRESDRAKAFIRRCRLTGVSGVSLHSYRYAWAERAKVAGYPERFAQLALGHNSKAVHRAYARKAQVTIPPLEEYEKAQQRKIVPFTPQTAQTAESEGQQAPAEKVTPGS